MADASMYGGAYAAVGQAAAGAITTHFQNQSSRIAADAANVVRTANNASAAAWNTVTQAQTNLQRWTQNVRNSRVYENVGRNQEALATNFNRSRDARTNANFADNIRQAEEAGRMQASAAASGVTGSVVDVLNYAAGMKRQIQETARLDSEAYANKDYKLTEFQTHWAILDQLDNGLILDTPAKFDFGTNTATTSSVLGGALGAMGTKGMQQVGIAAGNFFNFGTTDYGLGGKASAGTQGMGD